MDSRRSIIRSSSLKVFLLIWFLFYVLQHVDSQTVINGRVTDGTTFEPVVFANIIFKGTTIGVKTGFDGTFTFKGTIQSDSIVASFIGYETKTIPVIPGTSQNLDVILQPATYSIGEVMVKPGENPAHRILRKVWENRQSNSIENNDSYQFDNYSRLTVYFRKFRNDEGKRGFYDKEFEKFGISTGEEKIPAIPAFINETFSTTYFRNNPERTYSEIKAVNTTGLAFDKTDLISQLILKQENLNMTSNNVLIADKNFVSPLSRSGLMYYKYYLIDSIWIDKFYCYEINVIPKREEDPVFRGTIWINDTTYALKRISVEVTDKADINFIERIKIQQDYEPYGRGSWFPVRTRFMADAVNIFFSNFSGKSNFKFNDKTDPGFFSSELKIDPGSIRTTPAFWTEKRTSTLDQTDSLAISRIDSLRNNRKVRISARLVEASVRNYYDLGKFEAGPVLYTYYYNPVEGSRIRFGGRSNTSFSKNLYLEGYFAYGTKDNRLKGSIMSELFLSKERWTKIGFQFRDDIEKTGSVDEFLYGDSFMSFATSFGGWDKLNRSSTIRFWLESDVLKGLNAKLFYSRKTFDPLSPDYIFAWYNDAEKHTLSENYVSGEVGLSLRFQPRAVYVTDGLRRFPVNFNKLPAISMTYSRGIKNLSGGDFNYDRIAAGISNNFSIGGLGRINIDINYSRVFGQLPYPLLINAPGNESVFYSGRLYNLMNYGEFVADEAFQAFTEYHMDGLIMNKLPIIKKLHLRTVVSARLFMGSFNRNINGFYDVSDNPGGLLPVSINGNDLTSFNAASFDKPYSELSYGIENIFKFLRVDLVQRLTLLNNPDSRRYGIKFSGVFRF
jgi:hypothetical protein